MTINEGQAMVLLFLLQDAANCLSAGLGCALEWELHQRLSAPFCYDAEKRNALQASLDKMAEFVKLLVD
jgi:hypothetical protein